MPMLSALGGLVVFSLQSIIHMKNRRDFLKGMVALPVIGFVAACKSTPDYNSCADVSMLTPEEQQIRKTLGYVNETADAAKNCANCKLYVAPASGSVCGGCTIMKGTVSPTGFCNSWLTKGA